MTAAVPPVGASGVLLVDKPAGLSSFAVVEQVKRGLLRAYPDLDPRRGPQRKRGGSRPPRFKCGHAGTLDPLATGLLLILAGKGSRLSPFLLGLDKTYLATVRFGTATDTLDAEGEVTATAAVPSDPRIVVEALPAFRGAISQVPPIYSALKRDGQPLYKMAREGQDVAEPEARPVTIHALTVADVRWDAAEMDLVIHCSSGTYIRSLARDISLAAGTVGHLTALRRTAIGALRVEDAVAGGPDLTGLEMGAALLPLATALGHLPSVAVTPDEAAFLRQGGQPGPDWLDRLDGPLVEAGKAGRVFRLLTGDNDLVAVGRLDEETQEPRSAAVIPAPSQETNACD